MTLRDYLQLFLSKLWLLLLGTVLAAIACYMVATRFTSWPPYEARATVILEETAIYSPTLNAEGLKMIQRTITALASRPPLTQQVIEQLELDIAEDELTQFFSIDAPETTPLIEITSRHKDPQIAANISNAIAQEIVLLGLPYTDSSVLSDAKIPVRPILSSYLLPVIAGILGLIVTIGAILLAEKFNNLIRHERDVNQNLIAPLLGRIKCKKKRNGRIEAPLNKLEWVMAKIYLENGSLPDQLLITSPRESQYQSDFVYMFIHCKLGHNLQARLTDKAEKDQSTQLVLYRDNNETDEQLVFGKNMVYELDIFEWSISQVRANAKGHFKQSKIIDGTPVLSDANTALMASQLQHVLLVLDEKRTTISDSRIAEQLLNEAGANVIGSVLLS